MKTIHAPNQKCKRSDPHLGHLWTETVEAGMIPDHPKLTEQPFVCPGRKA